MIASLKGVSFSLWMIGACCLATNALADIGQRLFAVTCDAQKGEFKAEPFIAWNLDEGKTDDAFFGAVVKARKGTRGKITYYSVENRQTRISQS